MNIYGPIFLSLLLSRKVPKFVVWWTKLSRLLWSCNNNRWRTLVKHSYNCSLLKENSHYCGHFETFPSLFIAVGASSRVTVRTNFVPVLVSHMKCPYLRRTRCGILRLSDFKWKYILVTQLVQFSRWLSTNFSARRTPKFRWSCFLFHLASRKWTRKRSEARISRGAYSK